PPQRYGAPAQTSATDEPVEMPLMAKIYRPRAGGNKERPERLEAGGGSIVRTPKTSAALLPAVRRAAPPRCASQARSRRRFRPQWRKGLPGQATARIGSRKSFARNAAGAPPW